MYHEIYLFKRQSQENFIYFFCFVIRYRDVQNTCTTARFSETVKYIKNGKYKIYASWEGNVGKIIDLHMF